MIQRRQIVRCGLLGLTLAAVGCGGGRDDGRRTVYGAVTLDGAPLARGEIVFDPVANGGAAVSTGGVVVDGSYSIGGEDGPTPGKYKVSIRSAGEAAAAADEAPGMPPPIKEAKADPIPERYNTKSELTAVVEPNGSTKADFALTSK